MRALLRCLVILSLIATAWSIPVFCGEIHDAVAAGDDVASEFVAELLKPGGHVTQPVLLAAPAPTYAEEALKEYNCRSMFIQAVIRADGIFDSIEIIKGWGNGLDESVIKAIALKWRFKPATKDGVPIDTKVTIETRPHCF
jgi:hypothetical protein